MKNLLIATIVAVVTMILASEAKATIFDWIQTDLEYRRQIRSMDILERPDRLVHVYGNTVRHRYQEGRSFLYQSQ